MTPRNYYLFVNGICNDPANASDWQYLAQEYIQNNNAGVSEAYVYKCWPLTRFVWQWYRVKQCATMLRRAQAAVDSASAPINYRKIAVGHSNGCPILCTALANNPDLHLDELHLVAAAADADFITNGLNDAFAKGQIGKLFLYCSKADKALMVARLSKEVIARYGLEWTGLGYGDLGLEGPKNEAPAATINTSVTWFPGYDHGDYFGNHFDETMERVVAASNALME